MESSLKKILGLILTTLLLGGCTLFDLASVADPYSESYVSGWVFEKEYRVARTQQLLLLWQKQDWKMFGRVLKGKLKTHPSDMIYRRLYLGWLLQMKQFSKVDQLITNHYMGLEEDAFVLFIKGQNYENKFPIGRYWPEAVRSYRLASEKNPRQLESKTSLAHLYLKSGKLVAANEKAYEVVQKCLTCTDAAIIQVESLVRLGKYKQAKTVLSGFSNGSNKRIEIEYLKLFVEMKLNPNRTVLEQLREVVLRSPGSDSFNQAYYQRALGMLNKLEYNL